MRSSSGCSVSLATWLDGLHAVASAIESSEPDPSALGDSIERGCDNVASALVEISRKEYHT